MEIDTNENKTKKRFWIIALVMLLILAITTTIADILDTNNSDSVFVGILIIPSMPGFLIYVLTTGDIHGWQPGPIGQSGRIIVCTLGAWIFWLPFAFMIYKRKIKK